MRICCANINYLMVYKYYTVYIYISLDRTISSGNSYISSYHSIFMGYNMSYCMFQNSEGSVDEAFKHLEEYHNGKLSELSEEELGSLKVMIRDLLENHIPNVFGFSIEDVDDVIEDVEWQIDQAIKDQDDEEEDDDEDEDD